MGAERHVNNRARGAAVAWALTTACAVLLLRCGGNATSPVPDAAQVETGASCVPGASVACEGPQGCAGFQVCAASGTGYQPCDCGSSLDSGSDAVASPVDAATDVADVFVPSDASGLPTAITGVVQKGPFVVGSSITVQELDSTLNPTGKTFDVTTTDDEGDFAVPVNVTSRYLEVIASGYYFDELTNALSVSELTLRALADVSSSATVDVNLLTSMSEPLTRNLVAQGMSFSQAQSQAESSVLAALRYSPSLGSPFSNVALTGTGSTNAEVLAASLVVEQYAASLGSSEVAQLTQLLGEIGSATADSGSGSSTLSAISVALCSTIWSIDVASVRANLTAYYASLGASVTIPRFEDYLCGCGIVCGTTCINQMTDTNNCGSCGNQCAATGQTCQGGSCACELGATVCNGACVNEQTDTNNCGSCGNPCAATGQTCDGGTCACPSGATVCNGACVDEQTDPNNCGGCGDPCAAIGQTCEGGTCSCPSGTSMCNGACVNEQTDMNNCGGCGSPCAIGQMCEGGSCTACVGAGIQPSVVCNGVCVFIHEDTDNCGSCGNKCPAGDGCTVGHCFVPGTIP